MCVGGVCLGLAPSPPPTPPYPQGGLTGKGGDGDERAVVLVAVAQVLEGVACHRGNVHIVRAAGALTEKVPGSQGEGSEGQQASAGVGLDAGCVRARAPLV